jgi:hypothetical protein
MISFGAALTGTSEELVACYRGWLVSERSLAPSTIKYYVSSARLFLSDCDGRDLRSLQAYTDGLLGMADDVAARLAA